MTGNLKSGFLLEAQTRGFIFQCTDLEALDQHFATNTVSAYIGFDLTADSLHVGSLMQIMLLRLLRRYGHKSIVVLGGGTSRIGDPSFREKARMLMTDDTIHNNMVGITEILKRIVNRGNGLHEVMFVDNDEWLNQLTYLHLLRDVGIHFSVSRMLSFDSVRSRLEREQGLTFIEFNYSILQSYDFRELFRRYGTTLQMGGADQWGNIVSGVDLIRRADSGHVFGLTTPLLVTPSGAKMGKTADGAVWLSHKRLPVFDYWQFWRNIEDENVGRYLKLFTDLPIDECDKLGRLQDEDINEAKKILATEATAICYGREIALQTENAARQQFEQDGAARSGLPICPIRQQDLKKGITLFALLTHCKLVDSKTEGRKLVRNGGARINDIVVHEENYLVTVADLKNGNIKLSSGKKRHVLVCPIL